ncbi:tryptophan-rich protein [Plasmodium brasilianum]|uniref:Tryptophan-rich protein n=1 Tax=Plasmodium brasilianum TaxID=5824 RepID=A0ACB9Y8Z9_PLABR|nr:tryptophan-rich protein [Plasmodium brasilianum]
MKSILFFVSASAVIFKLSSTSESVNGCFSGICSGKTKPALCKSYNGPEDMPIFYLRQKILEFKTLEENKNEKWKLWFKKQKKDMIKDFKKKNNAWFGNKNEKWNNFLYNLEEKWLHYNPYMQEEYKSDIYDVCSNWSDNQWIEWFKTHGLNYITSDFESWFNEIISSYNKIMTCKLMYWKEKKKNEWDSHPFRLYEVDRWTRWLEKLLFLDKDIYIKVSAYREWDQRIRNEEYLWNFLIKRIKKKYINDVNTMVKQWCKEVMNDYNKWLISFYINWIENKQWNVWLIEKKMK